MTPINITSIVERFSTRNIEFNQEEKIEFDHNMISMEIAEQLVSRLPMLIFEKNNAQYPIDYFKFDVKFSNILLSKKF